MHISDRTGNTDNCIAIHLPDVGLVDSETRRRDIIYGKCLFIIDCAYCWFKYSAFSLLQGSWTALNGDVRFLQMCLFSMTKINIFFQYFFL